MVEGTAPARRGDTELVLVVDLASWLAGRLLEGGTCHVLGGGPLPVGVARELVKRHDAFVTAVLHDGVKIDTVAHLGRYRRAELQSALDLGPPPDFDGVACADGCGRRRHLQWDHVDPVANQGPTSYDNLAPRCWGDHQDKTERDRAAGLLGPGGGRGRGKQPTTRAGEERGPP